MVIACRHRVRRDLILGALVLPGTAWGVSDGVCSAWSPVVQTGTVDALDLVELSGIQASRLHSDLLWVHNDAGNPAQIHALDLSGQLQGSVTVAGIENEDWEDLAIGPCMELYQGSCSCLYLADTGSGSGDREQAVIYRIEEPDPDDEQTVVPQALWFRYPDGGHDSEAILVHPLTGETLVISKNEAGPAQVFAFPDIPPMPAAEDTAQELHQVGLLDMSALGTGDGVITGGAVSPLGHRILLRTESEIFELAVPGESLEAAFESTPVQILDAPATEGEAISFGLDGQSLWMVDEGENSPLWSVSCLDYEVTESPEDDPLLSCELPEEGSRCGCSGGEAAWLVLLPGLGWRRRRKAAL
jgi:hypothetical protein